MKNDLCEKEIRGPAPWRVSLEGAGAGEENMRRDAEALDVLRGAREIPRLRVYRWAEPTVSHGRLQDPAAAAAFARSLGVRALVRRPTGGGTVHHTTDVSFSLAWRRDHPAFPSCVRHVYAAIHAVLCRTLREAGLAATLHPGGARAAAPGLCYDEPVADDVLLGGAKIIGGALRVTPWGCLYQGNLKTKDGVLSMDAAALIVGAWEKTLGPPVAEITGGLK
ncbi:MAG TPA: hypothetical protein PKA08_03785 [Elusimicrobiota bacterium]|jgi:lipoate-protein ligase A|nr:hypothetical protein [Elusimicrobiota bacterium]HMU95879.1 hypothetical protein [Elusimicrobiota bacterium]HMX94611.1 hypothetical protein [Elusimicrobiota bacterium]HMZ27401.1 hypothetical protein [Elusimicrobiota bacterium]